MTVGIYIKNSAEAVELYKKAFSLELGYHVKNPDGSYFHSELCKDGAEVLSVVEAQEQPQGESRVQISFNMESDEDVKRAFDLLCEGGEVDIPLGPLPWSPCAASVRDRFGVWWYMAARSHRPPADYDAAKPWDASMYKKDDE